MMMRMRMFRGQTVSCVFFLRSDILIHCKQRGRKSHHTWNTLNNIYIVTNNQFTLTTLNRMKERFRPVELRLLCLSFNKHKIFKFDIQIQQIIVLQLYVNFIYPEKNTNLLDLRKKSPLCSSLLKFMRQYDFCSVQLI